MQKFVVQNGALQAVGAFTGTVTNTATGGRYLGDPAGNAASQPGGQHGVLPDPGPGPGAAGLKALGLQVHLDTVHLNITAQSGPGNLLGDLLCAVAG